MWSEQSCWPCEWHGCQRASWVLLVAWASASLFVVLAVQLKGKRRLEFVLIGHGLHAEAGLKYYLSATRGLCS